MRQLLFSTILFLAGAVLASAANLPPSHPLKNPTALASAKLPSGTGLPAVSSLTATARGQNAEISWSAPKDARIAGYRLAYGFEDGKYEDHFDLGPVSGHVLYGLEPGRTCFFSVSAYDSQRQEGAPAYANVTAPPPATPGTAADADDGTLVLEGELTAKGATLLSVPLDLGIQDFGRQLVAAGLSPVGIHLWSGLEQNYTPLKRLRPGQGFLVTKSPGKMTFRGLEITAPFVEVALFKGWNLIGVPGEMPIPLAALQVVAGGEILPYAEAAAKRWVGAVNGQIDGVRIPVKADAAGRLEPWHGYWLYAYQPGILRIPTTAPPEKAEPASGGVPAAKGSVPQKAPAKPARPKP